jgi:hypothetical protein
MREGKACVEKVLDHSNFSHFLAWFISPKQQQQHHHQVSYTQ